MAVIYIQCSEGGEEMKYEYGDLGEIYRTYHVGDIVTYKGRKVKVVEVDNDIYDMRIFDTDGYTKWIKQSEVTS